MSVKRGDIGGARAKERWAKMIEPTQQATEPDDKPLCHCRQYRLSAHTTFTEHNERDHGVTHRIGKPCYLVAYGPPPERIDITIKPWDKTVEAHTHRDPNGDDSGRSLRPAPSDGTEQ